MTAYSVVRFSATEEILNRYMGEAGVVQTRNSTDNQSELWSDSQPWQNRIWLLLLSHDIPQANTQKKIR